MGLTTIDLGGLHNLAGTTVHGPLPVHDFSIERILRRCPIKAAAGTRDLPYMRDKRRGCRRIRIDASHPDGIFQAEDWLVPLFRPGFALRTVRPLYRRVIHAVVSHILRDADCILLALSQHQGDGLAYITDLVNGEQR